MAVKYYFKACSVQKQTTRLVFYLDDYQILFHSLFCPETNEEEIYGFYQNHGLTV